MQLIGLLFFDGIYMEKIWKIPFSYIGHWTVFSALKGSCTATVKRDGLRVSYSIVPGASLWDGKENSGITVRYFCL